MAKAIDILDHQFETEVLNNGGHVLVDFWAPWCGPCRLIAPMMDWAAATYEDRLKVVKVEVDPNPETVKKYRVEGIPTLLLIKGGEVIERTEGILSKDKLAVLLDGHL